MMATTLYLDTAASALLATAFGIGQFMFGIYARNRTAKYMGLALTLVAAWFGLSDVIALLMSGDWLTLAIVGGVAIVGASVVDRFGPAIRYRLSSRLSGEVRTANTD